MNLRTNILLLLLLLGAVRCSASDPPGRAAAATDGTGAVAGGADLEIERKEVSQHLVNPPHASIEEAQWITDEMLVVGVAHNDSARAYPLGQISEHKVVNDTIGGSPILVTYCELCLTVIAFDPVIDNHHYTFSTFGVYQRVLVMQDNTTGSIWSQLEGKILSGPLLDVGLQLTMLPVENTTWGEWKQRQPMTTVMRPLSELEAQYQTEAETLAQRYELVRNSDRCLQANRPVDQRALVVGVTIDDTARAYFLETARPGLLVTNDVLAGTPIVVLSDHDVAYGLAFERVLDGAPITLAIEDEQIVDERGNVWNRSGLAIDGPDSGAKLTYVPSFVSAWYGWLAYHPQTSIYGDRDC